MISPMKHGRHLEDPISRNCLDRISSLPDEVLGHVLSFLPTTFAVTTSILSTRWRYLFTLTTCLSFEDELFYSSLFNIKRFKEYVDNFLKLHQMSPIKKFSLVCHSTYHVSDLERWFTYALQKGVEELHYELGHQKEDSIPNHDGFFMCETLVSLKMLRVHSMGIDYYYKIEIPLSTSLPKLKILHLDHIIFFDFESIERLFSSCGLVGELSLTFCKCDIDGHASHCTGALKKLTIKRCSFLLGTFEIDAPNLAYLKYKSNIGVRIVPSWKNTCSFEEAELSFKCIARGMSNTNEDLVRYEYDRELFKAAAYKVTHLRLNMDSVQFLLKPDEGKQMPDFQSLIFLGLSNCPYHSWGYLTCLLEKSPQLRFLSFDMGLHCCECAGYDCPDNCYHSLPSSDIHLLPFSCHVDRIQVLWFCRHECPLALMGHLLRNASDLKLLSVSTIHVDEAKKKLDMLMLTRASEDCSIEIC